MLNPKWFLLSLKLATHSISPKNPIKREKKKLVYSSECEDTMLL